MSAASIEAVVSACGAPGDAVLCWDASTGAPLSTLRPFGGGGCACAANGLALFASPTSAVGVVSVPTSARQRPHDEASATTAAAAAAMLNVWAWGKEQPALRCATPERVTAVAAAPLPGLSSSSSAVAVSPIVVAGAASGAVFAWDAASGALLCAWDAHLKRVAALALTADGSHVVSGGDDAVVSVWRVADVVAAQNAGSRRAVALRSWAQHALGVTGVAVCGAAGLLVASVSLDRTARVWDAATGAAVLCVVAPAPLSCIAVDPAGRFFVVGANDAVVRRYDLQQQQQQQQQSASGRAYSGHGRPVSSVAVSADGTRVVSGALDGRVVVWDTESGQPVLTFSGHKAPVACVCMAHIPRSIALGQAGNVPLAVSQFRAHPDAPHPRSDAERLPPPTVLVTSRHLAAGLEEIWQQQPLADLDAALADHVAEIAALDAASGGACWSGPSQQQPQQPATASAAQPKEGAQRRQEQEAAKLRETEGRWRAAASDLFQWSLNEIVGTR